MLTVPVVSRAYSISSRVTALLYLFMAVRMILGNIGQDLRLSYPNKSGNVDRQTLRMRFNRSVDGVLGALGRNDRILLGANG